MLVTICYNRKNGVIDMKVRFTEEQIIKILKEHEAGKKAVDIVCEYKTLLPLEK